MKKSGKLRLCLATESPTFSKIQLQESYGAGNVSPMTDLVANLSGASLETPPVTLKKRRLSLSDSDGAQTPIKGNAMECTDAMDCNDGSRLLKGGVKITGITKDQGGSFSRSRGFSRRIVLTPVTRGAESDSSSKENQVFNFPMPSTAISTVQTISPAKSPSHSRQRYPLEDYDPNSQDSGYGTSYPDKDTGFRFAEPFALPPRRQCIEQSPRKENSNSPKTKPWHQLKPPHTFHSLSSGSGSDSMDDGFLELFDFDRYSEDANLPFGLNNLLSNPISNDRSGIVKRNSINASPLRNESSSELRDTLQPFQRSFSFGDTTPNSSRARSCLFKLPNLSPPSKGSNSSPLPEGSHTELARNFKRPEPPSDNIDPIVTKRRKFSLLQSISENSTNSNSPDSSFRKSIPKLQRSFSESEATIMHALHRSTQEPDLIGDFTKPYLLPLIDGRHQDLKTIAPDTLAELIDGKYDDSVVAYSIVDCRYPYEFDGGHINGARNIYTKEQILKHFIEQPKLELKYDSSHNFKRKHIIIFHCEFSSERGPGLYRFLRNCDRDQNKECYPTLSYPELYLLEGGYKSFFHQHSHLCEPRDYRPMLHPDNEVDLRNFRAKSKSWHGDTKSRLAMRSTLKRLGL